MYKTRPIWQWIVFYLIIAVVAYGAVYYYFFNKNQANSPAPQPSAASAPAPSAPAIIEVSISNFAFLPASLNVKKGTTVNWTNNDGVSHTITGDNGGPASPNLSPGDSYSHTFDQVGTFKYHCSIHPGMTASVTVF